MSDIFFNPYPARSVDPNEPGLIAGYTFSDSNPPELAQFGRYINRGYGGAAYDLTTRVGTPLVGQGGGVYVNDSTTSYWSGVIQPVGAVSFGYRVIHRADTNPTADRLPLRNSTQHWFDYPAAGTMLFTPSNGVGLSIAPFSATGRGPCVWDALYSGGTLTLLCNGRQVDQDVIAANVPAGGVFSVGGHGEVLLGKTYTTPLTVAEARASYIGFAKTVISSWKPASVGEGPAGGIPTGAVGEGDWYCPSGASSLLFSYLQREKQLALTDSGALSLRRLSFMHPTAPLFGSWHYRFKLRDPATDNPRFGFTSLRDTDYTAAGSASTWGQVQRSGGVMQATLHYANGAASYTLNHSVVGVVGDICDLLVTHAVNGDWRAYLSINGLWASNPDSTVWNNVAQMSSGYISIMPRQSYIMSFRRLQSELTSQEL